MTGTPNSAGGGAAALPPFDLRYFPPEPDLAEMITSFYHAHVRMDHFDEMERADRPQFRIMLGGQGSYQFADGHRTAAYRTTIIGPTSGPARSIARGPFELFGFGMMPSGWATLMGNDAGRLTDRAVDAEDLFGNWMTEVVQTIAAAESSADKLVIGNNLVREIMKKHQPAPVWFTRIVDRWLMQTPSPQVADLVRETGMSIRSVERMTKHFYGLSPRMLARRYRAVRAAAALARGDQLQDGAVSDAFYDQSHLIREIKRFAGATPSQLATPSVYTAATTRGRKGLTGRVSPLLSET